MRRFRTGGVLALAAAGAVLAVAAGSCATDNGAEGMAPVELPEACRQGPFCVTGLIDDQYGVPVAGVRCNVLGSRGESFFVYSDGRGVFLTDKLAEPPREIRFEKTGFSTRLLPVPRRGAGQAARLFVTLRRIGEAECTCEPNALVSGRVPCPDEQCR